MGQLAFATFEEYVNSMEVWRHRVVRGHTQAHPFLAKDDLLQEGLIALWVIYERYNTRLPAQELQRLGTSHMKLEVLCQRTRAGRFGASGTQRVSLTAREGRPSIQLPGADGTEEMYYAFRVAEIERVLTTTEIQVLKEVLEPGVRTLAALRALHRRARGDPHVAALAQATALPVGTVQSALARIRRVARYTLQGGNQPMVDETVVADPDTQPAVIPEPKARAATKPKARAATKPKARAATEPKKVWEPPTKFYAPGTKVEYLGGSKAANLSKGVTGVVMHVTFTHSSLRYGFRTGKRQTILPAETLRKA
jgi:hypothetical protein